MRMWMISPELLCKKHLLGEHFEIHKHKHNFVKHHSIDKRISPVVQIEPSSMEIRHNQLVKEMKRRNYNHNSPYEMPDISYLPIWQREAKVDLDNSFKDLCERCPDCKLRIQNSAESGSRIRRHGHLMTTALPFAYPGFITVLNRAIINQNKPYSPILVY